MVPGPLRQSTARRYTQHCEYDRPGVEPDVLLSPGAPRARSLERFMTQPLDSDDTSSHPSSDDEETGRSRVHRRGFFREGLRHILRPIADAVEERLERVGLPYLDEEQGDLRGSSAPLSDRSSLPSEPVLRPPGALPGEEFLDRCLSSGQCVHACPVSAIKLAASGDPRLDGKPYIEPQAQACVACDDLSCMHVCPSGALVPVNLEQVRMGLAQVEYHLCVRTHGEDCQICVDKCPIGQAAITIPYEWGPVEVKDPGCIGCGVCEMYCPIEPRAITVAPPTDAGQADGGADTAGDDPISSGTYLPID